jgi:glycosyltransferase involved in cell wall biosynthesis
MLSFVIPAHNEEQHIGATVSAVSAAAIEIGEPFEIIVVDDASTDRTATIAVEHGARVIHVQHRQIAATRNSGAREAVGSILFFIDADTLANSEAIRACLKELDGGAVAGGCVFRFDGVLPLWAKILYPAAVAGARLLKLVGGCFLFCTREAFDAVGGFDERYYAAEEAAFIQAIKLRGRFVIPGPAVVTSGRKLRAYSGWRIVGEVYRWMKVGPEAYRQRDGLDLWYGERIADVDAAMQQSKSLTPPSPPATPRA